MCAPSSAKNKYLGLKKGTAVTSTAGMHLILEAQPSNLRGPELLLYHLGTALTAVGFQREVHRGEWRHSSHPPNGRPLFYNTGHVLKSRHESGTSAERGEVEHETALAQARCVREPVACSVC